MKAMSSSQHRDPFHFFAFLRPLEISLLSSEFNDLHAALVQLGNPRSQTAFV